MGEEFYIFLATNQQERPRSYVPRTKEAAQAIFDGGGPFCDTKKYTLCRLVPVSLTEEVITTTKKVIP